nr:SIR2 family protein [uncultured Rhodococcus sp.]
MPDMPSLDDPSLPLAFSLYSSPGAYAVLAGAGVSRGAGLPTAWDIVVDLIDQIAHRDGVADTLTSDTAEQWYEAKYGRTPTYSDVVEQLALTPLERQSLLRKYFEQSDESPDEVPRAPSAAHRAIARLMQSGTIRVVVTMNFDRLFEQALRELQIEPTIVATDADAQGLAPLHTVRYCIIHLHGDYLNAESMLNTTAELSGYQPHMTKLLERVLTDYGLLAAGWSVQHDTALREAVAAHYPSRFTMGWVEPGPLNPAAHTLAVAKKAAILSTTADDAFGHLADEVEAMRERRARHPMTLAVAASRLKRELSQQRPAISAHDMLAAEFARLHEHSAFHLPEHNDFDDTRYLSLVKEVVEASRIPIGSVAVLAYWGDAGTDSWWLPELERFAQPIRGSGSTRLLTLPLFAGSMMFYAAGVSAVAARRFDLLATLFDLRGTSITGRTSSIVRVLDPSTTYDGGSVPQQQQDIAAVLREALGLGSEPIDAAWQTFEVLRLVAQIMSAPEFATRVEEYAQRDRRLTASADMDQATKREAWIDRDKVLGQVASQCHVSQQHILAADGHLTGAEADRWGSPVAERLAEDVDRSGNRHPLLDALGVTKEAMWLALKGVSVQVGRRGHDRSWEALPAGQAGFLAQELWLDAHPSSAKLT